MRYKHLLSEEQLDELRMNPRSLKQFASSPEAQGIMAGFEAELVFTGLGGPGDDDYDLEPDMDADERAYTIQGVMDFFENDEWGYGIYGRQAERLQNDLDERYYEWHDEQMYEAFRDEAEDLIKKVIEDDDFDWDDEIRKQLAMMDLSEDEIEEAMEQGGNAPKFTRSSEQEAYAQENPGYQRYLEAREQADDLLNELVQDSLRTQDGNYDAALDDFRDSFYIDDDSSFFSDIGLRWMSDVAEAFDLNWPVMTGTGSSDGGFSQDNAEQLADDLHEKLGVRTKVSGGYHSAKRDDVTWIFEPDSSLDADDSDNMPVEIVSPPMPLLDCLTKMEQFFEWAESNGAYANSSTGFHMGVSMPVTGGRVDYVKLALFLGDEHVLKSFGRSGNHFCEAAMKKIRQRVKGNKEAIGSALELMKHNLLELAQKALEINNHGFGKYTSINPQGGNDSTQPHKERGAKYIEFRSAGGSNYFEDIEKLQNTLMRYAQAMYIASRPDLERKEYYKKLYKLIAPAEGDPSLDLFARFATGEISSRDLKTQWAEKALAKDAPELVQKGDWVVIDQGTGRPVTGQEYRGFTQDEARARAKQKLSPGSSDEGFDMGYDVVPMETGRWEIYTKDPDTGNEETLEIVDAERKGEAVDKVYDKYSSQNIGFFARPYYGDGAKQPEPKLTPRAKLAKNIRSAPAEEIKNWRVYDTKTGEVHYEQEGRKSSLVQAMRKMEIDQKLPRGRLAIEEIPAKEKGNWDVVYKPTGRVVDSIIGVDKDEATQLLSKVARQHDFNNVDDLELKAQEGTEKTLHTWEIVDRYDNNKVLDTIGGTEEEAERVRQTWVQRAGGGEDHKIGKRTVPTDASRERYNDRQELNPVTSQPPQGFQTQRPTTGDYYEVRSGDRVYGYVSTQATSDNTRSVAIEVKDYINQLTGRNDAQLVYKAGDPVQATASNGVPLWQIYQRDNGHVIHSFADHTQTSAWATAQGWLRDHGAEDPSLFSLRPMMSA